MKTIPFLLVVSLVAGQTSEPTEKSAGKDVIAVVLGKEITVKDENKLDALIFRSLLEQFAKDNKIKPSAEELDAFVLKTEQQERQQQIKFKEDRNNLVAELKDTALNDRERKEKEDELETIESILKSKRDFKERTKGLEKQLRETRRRLARPMVTSWKVNKALYRKYGGRVVFQQAGAEPLDAYRDFLKEQEKKGAFQILDKKNKTRFWRYFTEDSMHTFYSEDEGAKFINTPWWMMEPLSAE